MSATEKEVRILKRILLVLAVALVMAAVAAPSAVAQRPPEPAESQWCYESSAIDTGAGGKCFVSKAACEEARLQLPTSDSGSTPCEHEVVR